MNRWRAVRSLLLICVCCVVCGVCFILCGLVTGWIPIEESRRAVAIKVQIGRGDQLRRIEAWKCTNREEVERASKHRPTVAGQVLSDGDTIQIVTLTPTWATAVKIGERWLVVVAECEGNREGRWVAVIEIDESHLQSKTIQLVPPCGATAIQSMIVWLRVPKEWDQ